MKPLPTISILIFTEKLGSLRDKLRGYKRVVVGQDKDGNVFVEHVTSDPWGKSKTKRIVETAKGAGGAPQDAFGTDHLFDSKHIGVEWLAWLSHRRPHPPTPQEIDAAERERAAARARAMAVDEEQARRTSRTEAAAAGGAREEVYGFPKFMPQGAPPKSSGGGKK